MSEYPFKFVDEDGKVLCQLCGKPCQIITPRHLGLHSITFADYKKQFPKAPISSKEFNARSVYGREKGIFVKKTLDELENTGVFDKEDEIAVLEEPEISQLIIEEVTDTSKDICNISKNRILDFLRTLFTNIKKDYLIQVFTPDKQLVFETISDFADPVRKINIEFPKTFWHNQDVYIKPSRNVLLKQEGWTVIEIKSKSFNLQEVENIIKKELN